MKFRHKAKAKRSLNNGRVTTIRTQPSRARQVYLLTNKRKQTHGNTKHMVKHFNDSYDGESAYIYTVKARLKGLTVHTSPIQKGIDAKYRVSIVKDSNFREMSDEEWADLNQEEKVIREKTKKLDVKRRSRFRRGKSIDHFDLEQDCPELYANLPRKDRNK